MSDRRTFPWPLLVLPMVASAAVRDLWAPDEPRYAEIAREIWTSGDLLVLHLCGEVYADKPPLLFWLAGLAGHLGGQAELALRLPSLCATLATAWLVGRFAGRAWSEREAALAPAVYLTLALVVELGGRLQIDPLLNLCCTASLYLATAGGSFGAGPWRRTAAGLCAGLGALAKGPVAWAIVGLVLAVWIVAERRGRRPQLADLAAVLAALAPVTIWALAAIAAEPALRDELLYRQHLGRVTRAISHPGPPWQPAAELLLLTLPWTPVWLAAATRSFRGGRAADPGLRRALLQVAVLLGFFSLVAEKRNLYLLPAYPAVALLAARWLATAAPERAGRLWRTLAPAPLLLGLVGLAACAAFLFAGPIERALPTADGIWARGLALGLLLCAGALWTARAARRGDAIGYATRLAGTTAAGGLALALLVFPLVDPLKSAEDLAAVLAARPERPAEIPCAGVRPEGYRFYSGRPTVEDDEGRQILAALARDGDQFLALVSASEYEAMPAATRAQTVELHRARVGSRTVILLGRRR